MKGLEDEGGVTQVSLDNATKLIKAHGMPTQLDFKANVRACVYNVTATWPDETIWTFTGFAWGYGGTGPAGLLQFLEMSHVSELIPDDIPLDKYGKTDFAWSRYGSPSAHDPHHG